VGLLTPPAKAEPEVLDALRDAEEALRAAGLELVPISLPCLAYAVAAYYVIAAAEASANLARYDGIRYGLRPYYAEDHEQLVMQARSQGLGAEVKLRVMLGTFVLRSGFQDRYYARAQRIRSAIRAEMESALESVDALLGPVYPRRAFLHDDQSMDAFSQRLADECTVPANLAGLPALSVPAGLRGGLPAGVQLTAPAWGEDILFEAAGILEAAMPPPRLPDILVPGGRP
jgi:aspartyl-tRNA(Asn)/glutamyl-tRNA(Gln) amidotransferase subunit A